LSEPVKFLEIGKIVKTHGLKGRLKAVAYLESEETLQSLKEVYLEGKTEEKKLFPLRGIRPGRGNFILQLKDVDEIGKAAPLVGSRVLIPVAQREKLPDGEYYWQDLLGITAVTEDGHILGKIRGIIPTGSNDVYVCREGDREILLPAITEVIRKVDVEGRVMVVRLLDGL